jgi:hypothetical protein
MSNQPIATIATMGIDIGKNSFYVVGLDQRGAVVLRCARRLPILAGRGGETGFQVEHRNWGVKKANDAAKYPLT